MIDIETLKEHIDYTLESTHLAGIGERRQGKVRDIYIAPHRTILVASDRYSAFDRNLALVPFKGAMLTGIASFWFDATKDIIQNHIVAMPDPNVIVCKKCTVLPIEVVVRGYITGVTGTALWTLYMTGKRDFGDFTLPDGMKKNQKLDHPILTPTTKSDEHDRPVTNAEIVSEGMVEEGLWKQVCEKALALFARGTEIAASRGLILVDTKYEFGVDEDGVLTLVDEIHTPDSSRYWKLASYANRFDSGLEPEYFDKEFLRLWFKEHSDPYNDKVLPEAPKEMVAELSRRYIEIYETLTGKEFTADFSVPIEERIANNLKSYATN